MFQTNRLVDFQNWLKEKIAEETGLAISEVSVEDDFKSFKLDSLSMVSISYELETLIDKEISPTVFTEYNTINKLSEWLTSQK